MSKEGIILLDIDCFTYHKKYLESPTPLINDVTLINYHKNDTSYSNNLEGFIRSVNCTVHYTPNHTIIQYLKLLAKDTTSKVGLIMLHERGDNFYDQWS